MAILRLAGHAVLSLRMGIPASGNWTATIDVDTDRKLAGAVVLEDEGITYRGAVVTADVYAFQARADIVGGAGGLRRAVPVQHYVGVAARTVVAELLAAAGERLDPSSTASLLATQLAYWTRAGDSAAEALQVLCDELGARWRVLPNGAVWVGRDAWPRAAKSLEPVELDRDSAARTILLAPDAIVLRPGVTLRGDRIGRVEHEIPADGPLRTTAWVDA